MLVRLVYLLVFASLNANITTGAHHGATTVWRIVRTLQDRAYTISWAMMAKPRCLMW